MMRYLIGYKIYENLAQARSILSDLKISEDNEDFLELKSTLSKNMGYLGWFIKMHFKLGVGLDELKEFYTDSIRDEPEIISSLPQNLINYDNWEKLMDDIITAKNDNKFKKMLNEFPHQQKSLISDKNSNVSTRVKNLLIRLFDKPSRRNFISKISRYKNASELVDSLHTFVNTDTGRNFRSILHSVMNSGADIIYKDESNDIIITKVDHSQLLKLAGDTSWCIKSDYTFRSYTDGHHQYIIFLTDINGNMSKIGATIGFRYSTAHAINDSYVSENDLIKILEERGTNIDILKISKEEIINSARIRTLLNMKISKEDIFKLKRLYTVSDLELFTKDEIEDNNLLNKTEISKIQFKNEKRDLAYLMSNVDRIMFKLSYDDLISLNPTKKQFVEISENSKALDADALNKINALLTNIKVPLQVIKNTCRSLLQIGFVLDYCNVTSKDYDILDVLDSIKNKAFQPYSSSLKELVTCLLKGGWKEDLKSPKTCDLVLNKYDFGRFYSKFKSVLESIDYGLEGCKDIAEKVLRYILDGKKYFSINEIYASDETLIDLDDKHIKIIKDNFKDISKQILHRRDVAIVKKHLRHITPSGRIAGQGLFIANAEAYMRLKGRRGMIITPQEYYDDFFDIMSDEYWNSGDETDRIALYMMLALVKLNKIDEISKMKILWTYDFTESIVKYILARATHGSFVGELGGMKQDYSSFAEAFLLTESEGEDLLNYLLQHVKNDKMYYNVSNSKYVDDVLERHRIFSLVYYIKGWGFDRYYKLVENHKCKGGKGGTDGRRSEYIEDGKRYFTTDRYRIEYLEDILKYLAYKRLKDEFNDLIEKVMSWEFKVYEKKYTMDMIKRYTDEINRKSFY